MLKLVLLSIKIVMQIKSLTDAPTIKSTSVDSLRADHPFYQTDKLTAINIW